VGYRQLVMAAIKRGMILLSMLMICGVIIAQEIDQALWQERLLILIAPSAEDPAVVQQKQALRDAADAGQQRSAHIP